MKKTILTALGTVAILAVVAVPFVYAQGHHRDHAMGAMGMGGHDALGPLGKLEHLRKELNLSDQQVDEIKAIFVNLRGQNAPYHDQMRDGFHDVLNTLIQNPANVAGAQSILDRETQAENAMKANTLTAASKALSVLTPEQRTKLGDLIAKHQQQRQSHFSHQF